MINSAFIKRFLRAGLLAGLAGLVWVASASAHATLQRSQPRANAELLQPPAAIDLWFSEALEPDFSSARLLDAAGQTWLLGPVSLAADDPAHLTAAVSPLPPGVYTLAWETLSAVDGHAWRGSFFFTVLNSDGSRPAGAAALTPPASSAWPTPDQAAARWLSLLGGIGLLGVPVCLALIVQRAGAGGLVNELSGPALWFMGAAAAAGLLGGAWQLASGSGADRLVDLALGTRVGALIVARAALGLGVWLLLFGQLRPWKVRGWAGAGFGLVGGLAAMLLAALGVAAGRGQALVAVSAGLAAAGLAGWAWRTRRAPRPWPAALLAGALILASFSAGSHAGAAPGGVWPVLADYLHLLAAGVWLGGLLFLPVVIARAQSAPAGTGEVFWPVVQRYARLALAAVAVLLLTGALSSLAEFPNWPSLFSTPYGRTLLVKLAWLLGALALAFFNRRLVQLARADWPRLARQVLAEALFGLLLLAATAVLTQTQPPRVAAGPAPAGLPFLAHLQADDLHMHLQVTPNQVGLNQFQVELYHEDNTPVGEVQLVRLSFAGPDAALGPSSVDLAASQPGWFSAAGPYLNQPGEWTLTLYVRRRGLDDVQKQVPLSVP